MHSSTATPPPDGPGTGYPGRETLDKANAVFRRAVSRAAREGRRHDPTILPQVENLVTEAAGHLERLAQKATEVEGTSSRHRDALERAEADLGRTLRRLARTDPERAARIARGAAGPGGAGQ